MRTSISSSTAALPPRIKPRSKSVREIAPSLAPQTQKNRANVSHPAPPLPVAIETMPYHERAVIDAAIAILKARLRVPGGYANSPKAAHELAMLHYVNHEIEGFGVMFLDAQNGLIAVEELFRGTITQTSVYPREVARSALRHNAATVILMHNHPSGSPSPSAADRSLTIALAECLALIDVRTVDHLIVAGDRVLSFAEERLL